MSRTKKRTEWKIETLPAGDTLDIWEGDNHIAEVFDMTKAPLIAAAPELLEALKVAQDLTDKWKRSPQGADFHHVDKVLRDAIASAEGRAQG